jgi:uncharacterized integral membrane protein
MTESETRRSSRSARVLTPRRITALVLAAIFILLIAANRQPVTVRVLLIDITGPLWVMLVVSSGLGALLAWLVVGRRRA